jgi:hydrogenase maturation factor
MEGKIDLQTLQHSLLSKLGKKNAGIVVSSLLGVDACAYDFSIGQQIAQKYYNTDEECYTICKSDPITFPTPNPGRYAIIINLNDLACLGAVPYGILVTWLLPAESKLMDIEKKQLQLHESALEFGITILGGHTEFTSAVTRPIISLSMIGFTPKSFLPSRVLKPGDKLYLLGNVANEGTAIIGHELLNKKEIPKEIEEELKFLNIFENNLSIFSDALEINKKYHPKVMHDPTEGGLLGAVYEMISPYNLGVNMKLNVIQSHIAKLTKLICNFFDLDVFRLISSGTLLICSDKPIDTENLKINHLLNEIGEITLERDIFIDDKRITPPEADQLIKAFKKLNKIS